MITYTQWPGEAGVYQTVSLLRALVNNAMSDPLIRSQAAQAIQSCAKFDRACQAATIGRWVRSSVRYVEDPLDHELIADPRLMALALSQGRDVYGDCDDMTGYAAALAKSVGLPVRFIVCGRGETFHHIYPEIAGYRVDATVPVGVEKFVERRLAVLDV